MPSTRLPTACSTSSV
ncbi:hypothetical protein SMAC4_13331 [Sordaria macrospora]|nr:hypothetical protein SMAC4_13331 [Sordaria macrospora]